MPINLKQLKGEALNQVVNSQLNGTGLRANFDSNGLRSISGNFNQLLQKKQRPQNNPNNPFKSSANPTGSKVEAPLIFPTDLDNDHYLMFHVMDRRRPSRADVVTKRALKTIVLPLPSQLTDGRGVAYNTENLTAIGAMAAGRMNLSGDSFTQGLDMVTDAFDMMMGTKKSNGASVDNREQMAKNQAGGKFVGLGSNPVSALLTSTAITGLASKGGGFLGALAGAASAGMATKGIGVAEGLAINPHTAVLFDNVNFREFNFTYKFVARNLHESDLIKQITNTFQYAMLPSAGGKFAGFAYEYPEEFELEFADSIKPYMFNFGRCVLKNFSVNYNGENMPVFFEDTQAPVSIEINLGFQETELLSKESIQERPFEIPEVENEGEITVLNSTGQAVSGTAYNGELDND